MAVPIFSGGVATIKSLIWDGDLTAPNPYKIHANTANCLKEFESSTTNNIVDIRNIGFTYNDNCRYNKNYTIQKCDNLNFNTIFTSYDDIKIVNQDGNVCYSCNNNVIKDFRIPLSDDTVLKVTAFWNNPVIYNILVISCCCLYSSNPDIYQYQTCPNCFLQLSNLQYEEGKISGTLTVSQFKDVIKKSNNHVVIGGIYLGDANINAMGLRDLKIEVLNPISVSMLREQPQGLTRTEYNTLHNIVDDDTQVIAQR